MSCTMCLCSRKFAVGSFAHCLPLRSRINSLILAVYSALFSVAVVYSRIPCKVSRLTHVKENCDMQRRGFVYPCGSGWARMTALADAGLHLPVGLPLGSGLPSSRQQTEDPCKRPPQHPFASVTLLNTVCMFLPSR